MLVGGLVPYNGIELSSPTKVTGLRECLVKGTEKYPQIHGAINAGRPVKSPL